MDRGRDPVAAGGLTAIHAAAQDREQLTAAVDPDLVEDRLQMILNRVAGDEETLATARVSSPATSNATSWRSRRESA